MALVSPGVEVTVIDQSQYLPAATSSVPFILLATAQNKTDATGGGVALGTTVANADKVTLISSQRELVTTYGMPAFYSVGGTPINGYELNEYGLLAAYSVLGTSNRAYIQRANIDLTSLAAASRPTGDADNADYWLDTAVSTWGIFEWSATTQLFTNITPTVIIDTDDLASGIPKESIGAIGDYAVVATNVANPIYYKNSANDWVLVGSDAWMISWPTIQGTVASPTLITGNTVVINGQTVTLGGTTVTSFASAINSASITGITAAVVSNKLEIYANSDVSPDGSSLSGDIVIGLGTGTPFATCGITVGNYYNTNLQQAPSYNNPRWKSSDTGPRPTGSVWIKTNAVNAGTDLVVKRYSSTTGLWTTISVPVYANDQTALKNLDASGGGENIFANTLYAQFDTSENDTATYKLFQRARIGDTNVTSEDESPVFVSAETFTISASVKNSTTMSTAVTATLGGTTAAHFVSAFTAANVANITAAVTSSGAIKITHLQGGVIILKDTSGTPVADAGIAITLDNVRAGNSSDLILSNYVGLTYTADVAEPSQDPANLTNWYYAEIDQVDIMIHDGTTWKGYRGVSNDSRGFVLTTTDPAGPQISPTAPTTQSDDTALVYGDLWIDTSDVENYPLIKRWEAVEDVDQWVTIDNTDQTTENGILFADARWGTSGTVDPITDDIPTILSLLTSNYLDIDAPDPDLYPAGTLLWNMRRSGFNVKRFKTNYFNGIDYPEDALPTEKDCWVSVSGNKDSGAPYMGRKAVRAMVVAALRAGLDANTSIREEQKIFNLLACPGYPELTANLVTLNNDRNNTGFVLGDTPMRLADNGTAITTWATNADGLGSDSEDGLVSHDPYAAVFYPSGKTTDLAGNKVVVPATHMVLRTLVRADEIGFPWLAPAGNLRGLIDNAESLGFIDVATNEYIQISNRLSLRDTLYENSINPLTFMPGSGLMNFGNKTIASQPSAMDRINVARLIAYVRGRLEIIARAYMFEPNDTIVRNELKNSIEQLLNDITAKRGIYDYLVVCDESNNTPTRIDRSELYVDIAIEPTKAVEFIYIPLRIKNTGDIALGNL